MPSSQHKGCSPYFAVRVLASQSRCGNHRLESRVRENRTHGSEGGDGESRFRPLSILGSRIFSPQPQFSKECD